MSRPVNIQSAVTVNIATFDSVSGITTGTTYPPSNGCNSSANTSSYAMLSGTTTNASGYAYYSFSGISIPSNATIESISCRARARTSNANRGTGGFQLMAGNTAKGSQTTFTSTTVSAYTLTAGTWTASELNSGVRLRVLVRRTSSQQGFSVRFYGATLTVNYSVNGTEYEVSFVNDSYDSTTSPSTTQYVIEGGEQEISVFTPNIDDISVKDNDADVTNSLTYHAGGLNTASVGSVSGARYGFTLDGQYYKSQNAGQSSSYALCRLNITASTECTLTLYLINSGEATYDYGLVGNLDTALSASSAITSDSYYWIGNTSGKNSTSEQVVTMTIPSGTHFVDFKYRKDNYTDSGNDALWFRYDLPAGSAEPYYTYTISNISADHVITLEDVGGVFYAVNASSNYAGAIVSPATKQVREGRNHTITITAQNAYEFTVTDNGVDVTGSVVPDGGNFSYAITNVTATHNVVVNEATKFLVLASSKSTGTTISPSSTYVYSGQSITLTLTGFSAKNKVFDNDVDVTSQLVQSGSNYLYTISNISTVHEIAVHLEANYVRVNGGYVEIKKYYKKVLGEWTEITKTVFNQEISESVFNYGGHYTGSTIVGEVVRTSDGSIQITVNDNALQSGTYKFVYEDAGKSPLDNTDEITEFTV